MEIDTSTLRSISNYARINNVSSTCIYKLINSGKIDVVTVDGRRFIDIQQFPSIIKTNK